MTLYAVAIGNLGPDAEAQAAALAEALGLTMMEARARVRPPVPRVVATYRDGEEASARAAALALAGFSPILVDGALVEDESQRVGVRGFQLHPQQVTLTTRTGESYEVPYRDMTLLLSVVSSSFTVHHEEQTKRKLSVGKAVLTGGMVMTSKKKVKKTSSHEQTDSFLVVYAAGHPPFVLRQAELQYQGLGPALQPVQLANYRRLLQEIRDHAPGALFDDRLATPGGQLGVLGGILPPDRFLDVALTLLRLYHE